MTKVVYGYILEGFDLSDKAIEWFAERGVSRDDANKLSRHDPLLVECVESLGCDFNRHGHNMSVREIPGDKYVLFDNDYGYEELYLPYSFPWNTSPSHKVARSESGWFVLSDKAIEWLVERGVDRGDVYGLSRSDDLLIECIETLGKDACGEGSDLRVHKLKGDKWLIDSSFCCGHSYGMEDVLEPHMIRWITIDK